MALDFSIGENLGGEKGEPLIGGFTNRLLTLTTTSRSKRKSSVDSTLPVPVLDRFPREEGKTKAADSTRAAPSRLNRAQTGRQLTQVTCRKELDPGEDGQVDGKNDKTKLVCTQGPAFYQPKSGSP